MTSTTKTPRQEVTRSTWPPMIGARIGARPLTSISIEKNLVIAMPEKSSRTVARAITMPAAAPMAWTTRAAMSNSAVGANAQSAEPIT